MGSIWSQTCSIGRRPPLRGHLKTQAAVVGAGMAGVLTAYALQQAGLSVVVLEAGRIAGGQTQNTTAKITSQHGLIYSRLIQSFGEETARRYAKANQDAVRAYQDLIDVQGISCDWEERCAYLYGPDVTVLQEEAEAARRLGLPEEIIDRAAARLDAENVRFEDVLTKLDQQRQEMEKDRAEARRLKLEMEQSAGKAREYRKRLEEERSKVVEKAQAEADRLWRQREEDARKARTFREQMEKAKENARTKGEAEAKRIVRQAQAQADEIFAQLDQLRRQQQKQINFQELNDAKAAVRHSLNQAQEALHLRSEPQEPAYAPSRPIEVGDLVELPGVKMAASVLAVNNDGTLLLQAGKMKMTVKAQQVRLPEGQPKKKPAAPVGGSPKLNLQSRASSELDIRGYETLEAESVVENYIDSAVMAKLGTVTIIHGKGTGALRKAVHEMLKRNKAVKSFRLGRYGEGEAGVTVVELK